MKKKSPKMMKILKEQQDKIEKLKSENLVNSYLGNRGYTIYKNCLSNDTLEYIKTELIAKPFVNNQIEPTSFPIYLESDTKIYVPRFWGIKNFGYPKKIKIKYGEDIDLKFHGKLRTEPVNQPQVINSYLEAIEFNNTTNRGNSSALIELLCGAGKTVLGLKIIEILKKKTIIFVHKTFLKNQWIERIKEFLPDAKIGTIQGQVIDIDNKDIVIAMIQSISMKSYPESMFDSFGFSIYDECFKGNTLIHTNKGKIKISELYDMWIRKNDIEILSFNKSNKTFQYKPLTFAWKKKSNDFIKLTLSKQKIECTTNHKILTIDGYQEANKLEVGSLIISKYDINHKDNLICPCLNDDQLQIIYGSYLGDGCLQVTKKNRYRLKIIHCKQQREYCNWKAEMLNINNINYIEKNGYSQKEAYSFISKCFDLKYKLDNKKIVPDWLIEKIDARGVAIWFMDDGSVSKHTLKDGTTSYFAKISSNNFDYENNIKLQKIFNKFNITTTIYKTRNYYEIQFNKENTMKLFDLIRKYNHTNMDYKINFISNNKYIWNNKFLDYGTMIVTSKEYINSRTTNVYDIEVKDNHNFIIATKSKTNFIDGPVVSNCHHISSEIFNNCLKKCTTLYGLGLSATMNRKDGLSYVFKMFLGDICYKNQVKSQQDNVLVKAIDYHYLDDDNEDDNYNMIERDFRGNVKYTTMLSKVSNLNYRSDFIITVILNELKINPDQQILLLAHQRNLLNYLYKNIENQNFTSIGYYVGGMKQDDLNQSEKKQIILATYSMAAEALDIKTLTTLVLATPKSDIVQAVGRILRAQHSNPLIIDIIDQHDVFLNQFNKRRQFYNEKNYKIVRTDNENYQKSLNDDKLDIWRELVNKKKSSKLNSKCLISVK